MTYLAIIEGRARFAGDSSLRTWLFSVIANIARSHWRKVSVRLRRFVDFDASDALDAPDDTADPTLAPERHELQRTLRAAWRTLPPRQREVLDLVFYRDMTIAEAAAVIGVSIGTARQHYERAKAALRANVDTEAQRA